MNQKLKRWGLALAIVLTFVGYVAARKQIHHVFDAIDGDRICEIHQDGKTWETAFTSLAQATNNRLEVPVDEMKNGDTIFIATKDGDTLLHIVAKKEFTLSRSAVQLLRTIKRKEGVK